MIRTQSLIENFCNADHSDYEFGDIVNLKNGTNRYLYINSIDNDIADSVNNYIKFYNDWDDELGFVHNRKPITLFINSYGGDLVAAFSIIDSIRLSKTPVITVNIGAAYSAGFFIFINGHKRIAYKNSSFLFHEGSAGTSGDAHKFRNFSDFYQKQLDRLKDIILDKTKFTEEEYQSFKKDDYWLMADEALKYGVCDEVK